MKEIKQQYRILGGASGRRTAWLRAVCLKHRGSLAGGQCIREAQARIQTLKDHWGVLSKEEMSTLHNLNHLVGTDCRPARCGSVH